MNESEEIMQEVVRLWPPCAALALIIVFVVFIRWFGKFENRSEVVGSDLNLLTFGFAVDLLVRLMQSQVVFPRLPWSVNVLVPVMFLLFVNLILYMVNLRLGRKIVQKKKDNALLQAIGLKFVSVFLGIISATMYVVAQSFWN